jgi:lactoylglutathione lyase
MKTLHPAWRVSDIDKSLAFYAAVGYEEVGRVDIGGGTTLVMLKFLKEPVVTLELVYRPADGPVQVAGFSHLGIQVDDLEAMLASLNGAGLQPGPIERPGGPDGPRTSWLIDPDGYRLELVQWPPGHADGISAADFEKK